MDIREWKNLALRSVCLLVAVLLIGAAGTFFDRGAVQTGEKSAAMEAEEETVLEEEVSNIERMDAQNIGEQDAEQIGRRYIKLEKVVTGQAISASLENDYMDLSLILTLEGDGARKHHAGAVQRQYGKKHYTGDGHGGKDPIKSIQDIAGKNSVRFVMKMNSIYEPSLLETETAWYIVLDKPWEVYEHIVVIDAGHGGSDKGTGSVGWKYREKEYALRVAVSLKKILDGTDIKAYYTRLEDIEVTKEERVRLANRVHADAFISIHCNASDQTETTANGVEALYSTRKQTSGEHLTSKVLARNILEQVCANTGRRKRKIIRRNDLYLMHHSKVPVTIVEVGYMTNNSDMRYLLRDKNQMQFARGIYLGLVKSFK